MSKKKRSIFIFILTYLTVVFFLCDFITFIKLSAHANTDFIEEATFEDEVGRYLHSGFVISNDSIFPITIDDIVILDGNGLIEEEKNCSDNSPGLFIFSSIENIHAFFPPETLYDYEGYYLPMKNKVCVITIHKIVDENMELPKTALIKYKLFFIPREKTLQFRS